jgi:hypothetical protein
VVWCGVVWCALDVRAQDVPAGINGLLDSLPAKVSIQGLPFDAVFTYAVYTLNYVIVKVGGRQEQHELGVVWQHVSAVAS